MADYSSKTSDLVLDRRNDAIEILRRWTAAANEKRLSEHSKVFFRAWDLLDGFESAKKEKRRIVLFLSDNIRPGPDRAKVLGAIEEASH